MKKARVAYGINAALMGVAVVCVLLLQRHQRQGKGSEEDPPPPSTSAEQQPLNRPDHAEEEVAPDQAVI